MSIQAKPISLLPTEKSKTDDWINFYNALKSAYGEKAANTAFIKRWTLRRGKGVDVVDIQKATGLNLEKNILESIQLTGSNTVDFLGGFVNTLGTGGKVVFYAGIGLGILLVGGVIYRVVTISASEAGTAAGVAAKVYSGKP